MTDALTRQMASLSNLIEQTPITVSTTQSTQLSRRAIPCKVIRLLAPATNTGVVHIGSKIMTTTNSVIRLSANMGHTINIQDASLLFCIGTVGTDKLNWAYGV